MFCYIIKIVLWDSWGVLVMIIIWNVKIIYGDKLFLVIVCILLYVDDFK